MSQAVVSKQEVDGANELLEGWEETTFGEAIRSVPINDKKLPKKKYSEHGKFPVVDQGQEFIGGYCDEKSRLVEEDLPLIIFGDHTRIFKYLNQPFVPGADGVKVLKPIGVDEKWLFHIAHALEFPDKGYARHFQHLKKARLLIPPLPEQRRIVARIEALFTRLDAGVAALKQAKAQLKRYRQSVLAAAVTGELTKAWREANPDVETAEVLLERILKERREQWNGKGKYKEPIVPNAIDDLPGNWTPATSDQLVHFVTSGSRGWAKYYSDEGATFLRIGNLEHEDIALDLRDIQRVTPPEGAEGSRTRVQANDILISITADVGMVALVDTDIGEAYINQHVALARPSKEIEPRYLAWLLASKPTKAQWKLLQRGATKVGLGLDDIRAVQLGLPPIAEQHQIVAEIEARTSAIDHLEAELDGQITRSNRLRQSTLSAAFSGNLQTQS